MGPLTNVESNVGGDPKLTPLNNFGGPTLTRHPFIGSPTNYFAGLVLKRSLCLEAGAFRAPSHLQKRGSFSCECMYVRRHPTSAIYQNAPQLEPGLLPVSAPTFFFTDGLKPELQHPMRTLTTALLALLAPSLHAQEALITPTAITSSTSASDLYPVANLINGSGLSGTPTLAALGTYAAANNTVAWVTRDNLPDYYAGAGALPAPVLTCTLPGVNSVSELVVWGYHFGSANGNEGKAFAVAFSTDGVTFANTVTVTSGTPLATGGLRLPLPGGPRAASHVRVTITDNHHGAAAGGDRVGLGELKFAGHTPIVVTTAADAGAGSLRAALATAAAAAGPNTIVFDPAVFNGEAADTITLTTTELPMADAGGVTIDASLLPRGVTLSGNNARRFFSVTTAGVLTLRGLHLTGGNSSGNGGAILNFGNLSLSQCSFSGNQSGGGGAISAGGSGRLTAANCTFFNNSARFGGAIVTSNATQVTLTHCTFTGNRATGTSAATDGGGPLISMKAR